MCRSSGCLSWGTLFSWIRCHHCEIFLAYFVDGTMVRARDMCQTRGTSPYRSHVYEIYHYIDHPQII